MEAGMAHNAALIEERDQGIREISRQIVEVNEMFQDLAVLINDQGVQVRGLLNRLCKREPKP
jgi:syntaxin 7